MEEDSLVKEILQLKQQLQEEQKKLENVDNLLFQARRITSVAGTTKEGEKEGSSSELLREEKESHNKTRQLLEEEKKALEADKQQITKLQKRIKDLLQGHSNTLAQLEEERSNMQKANKLISELESK